MPDNSVDHGQTSDTSTINKKDFTAKTVESAGASESVPISEISSDSYMDIGLLVQKGRPIGPDDGERRLKLLEKTSWLPPPCHVFPQKSIGKSKRRFPSHLLSRYPWLRYSKTEDAAYCVYCIAFAKSDQSRIPFVAPVTD